MPRYFLDFRITGELIEDEAGIDFPDIVAAREEAILAARELTASRIRVGKLPRDARFEIKDAFGAVLAVVPFSDAIEPGWSAFAGRITSRP
jgi:hypothetical protein